MKFTDGERLVRYIVSKAGYKMNERACQTSSVGRYDVSFDLSIHRYNKSTTWSLGFDWRSLMHSSVRMLFRAVSINQGNHPSMLCGDECRIRSGVLFAICCLFDSIRSDVSICAVASTTKGRCSIYPSRLILQGMEGSTITRRSSLMISSPVHSRRPL